MLVLGFTFHKEQAKPLLKLLSKNAGLFHERYQAILDSFLTPFPPTITRVLEFGADDLEWLHAFPSKEKFIEMTQNGEIVRPIQITYKNFEDRGRLTAIELLFSNEVETPLYEDDGYKQDDF